MSQDNDSEWPEIVEAREKKLKTLYVNGETNPRESSGLLPESIYKLQDLERLEVIHVDLSFLDYELTKLTNLKEIILNHNNVMSTSEWFNDMPSLTYMDLSHNKFTVVPEEFNIPSLKTVKICHNELCVMPDISPAKCLTTLILHDNELERLPEGLEYCPNIREIDVSKNAIEECEAEYLKELPSLRVFDISYNEITEFPPILSECRHLESLKIKGNPITDEGLKAIEGEGAKEILDYLAAKNL